MFTGENGHFYGTGDVSRFRALELDPRRTHLLARIPQEGPYTWVGTRFLLGCCIINASQRPQYTRLTDTHQRTKPSPIPFSVHARMFQLQWTFAELISPSENPASDDNYAEHALSAFFPLRPSRGGGGKEGKRIFPGKFRWVGHDNTPGIILTLLCHPPPPPSHKENTAHPSAHMIV